MTKKQKKYRAEFMGGIFSGQFHDLPYKCNTITHRLNAEKHGLDAEVVYIFSHARIEDPQTLVFVPEFAEITLPIIGRNLEKEKK